MANQIFTVTDLGGGDGGKGGVVHKICLQKNAHTVLKVGGAQGSHGVRTAFGQLFNFSQFGCGTFEGIKTHITELMVIEPYRLLDEAERLINEWGIKNIFSYITVDENALCVTPFHTFASQLRELARKDKPKGTVGVGIGEAKRDAELHSELAIYAKDLLSPNLHDKLVAVWEQKIKDLAHIIENVSELFPADIQIARENIEFFKNPNFIARVVQEFNEMGRRVKIVDKEYFKKNILDVDGTIVVESSHGVLTDKYYGFHPHTTQLRTMPIRTIELLNECGYDGDIFKLGVTRAYQIRHGAGPMPTQSDELLDKLLPGSSKNENRWQGKVRVGPLDFVALRYAVQACGGPEFFDGIALTWFDQIQLCGDWKICDGYTGANNPQFFAPDGNIKVRHGNDLAQLKHQEELGNLLNTVRPIITSYSGIQDMNQQEAIQLCSEVFESKLHVPVRLISFGATEEKQICI